MNSFVLYSLILPVYNEEENIGPLSEEIFSVMDSMGESYEVIFVEDGSTDGSARILENISSSRDEVRIIRFRKNFGQAAALSAGFDYSRGEVVITLDADHQNDPHDIPGMVDLLRGGYDVVCGWRVDRKDKGLSRKLPSYLANWLIRRITGVRVHDYGCTLKVFRKDVIKHLPLYGGLHRFIPALATEFGARITEVSVNHRERVHGRSKYNISRTFPVVMDLLYVFFTMKFSRRPFYFFGGIGLLLTAAGSLLLLYLCVLKIFFGQDIGGRPLLIFGTLFFIGGIQLFSLGLLAGLQYKLHIESKEGTSYSILEIIEGGNYDKEAD